MENSINDIYTERVNAVADAFIKDLLADVKSFMPNDEYLEMAVEMKNIFLAGANCARKVMLELIEMRREGKA